MSTTRLARFGRAALLVLGMVSFGANELVAQPSLQVLDPERGWRTQRGTIEEAVISVRPQGAYLEYGLYLTISARDSGLPSNSQLEIEYFFDLPEGAVVTDSWLWVGDDIMQALIIDRWTASQIYEGIVNRRRDPSILFKRSDTRYELRIYPLMLGESRKVKLTYLVPAQLSGGAATGPLPLDMLAASRSPVKQLEILSWTAETWGEPSLLGSPSGPDFELREDSDLGKHHYRLVECAELTQAGSQSIAIPVPFRDGVFFTAAEVGQDYYYQIILEPSTVLDDRQGRNVIVLVDHDATNSSLSGPAAMEAVKAAVMSSLTTDDHFNLFVSQLEIRQYSQTWTQATVAALDEAFTSIGPPADYSSLPGLLAAALNFAEASGEAASIVLVSSSDGFSSSGLSDQLLEDLGFSTFPGTLQVIDFQDTGISQYRVGGIWYRGNGYLYKQMAASTGGAVSQLDDAADLLSILPAVVRSRGRTLSSIDLFGDLAAGYTFDRFSNLVPGEDRATTEAIVQTGRYLGTPPFSVAFSGVHNQDAFSRSIDVPPEAVVPGGPGLKQAWVGHRIRELEGQSQSTDVINQLITLSLENRILTEYTAFLALEPSDTTQACSECVDETSLVSIEPPDELPATDSLLQVYPNPVREMARIEVSLPAGVSDQSASLAMFDLLGREVRRFSLRPGSGRQTFQWDRRSEGGGRLASGVYLLSLRVGSQARSLRVVVL